MDNKTNNFKIVQVQVNNKIIDTVKKNLLGS